MFLSRPALTEPPVQTSKMFLGTRVKLATPEPPCGVPKNTTPFVRRYYKYYDTGKEIHAFLTTTPPRLWQIKTIGTFSVEVLNKY
jgi:hypothetical protein